MSRFGPAVAFAALSTSRVRTPPVAAAAAGAAPPAGVATAGRQGGVGGAERYSIIHVCLGGSGDDRCGCTSFEHENGRRHCTRCGVRWRGSWCGLVRYRDLNAVIEQAAAVLFEGIATVQHFLEAIQ